MLIFDIFRVVLIVVMVLTGDLVLPGVFMLPAIGSLTKSLSMWKYSPWSQRNEVGTSADDCMTSRSYP